MSKRVFIAGLLGTVVFIAWGTIVNGLLRFRSSIDMNVVPNESRVYEILKQNITEPGRYTCNPEVIPHEGFPGDEPVFGILYSGMGHGTAGRLMLVHLLVFILTPVIAAWMLSLTSARILSSYPRKVLFFTCIGLLVGLFGNLMGSGIGGYPLGDALLLVIHDVVLWTLVGLVVAWRLRPEPAPATP